MPSQIRWSVGSLQRSDLTSDPLIYPEDPHSIPITQLYSPPAPQHALNGYSIPNGK